MKKSIIIKAFLTLFVIIIIVVAGFIIWGSTPQGTMPEVEPYLRIEQQTILINATWDFIKGLE